MKQGKKTYRPSFTEDSIAVIINLCKTELIAQKTVYPDTAILKSIVQVLSPFLAKVQNGAVTAAHVYSVDNPRTSVEQRIGMAEMPQNTMQNIEEQELSAYQCYVSGGRTIEVLSLHTIELVAQYLCKHQDTISLSHEEKTWIDKKFMPWLFDSNGERIETTTAEEEQE